MSKKEANIEFLDSKKTDKSVTYELLEENPSERVTKLLSVYKESPFKARVLYFNNKENYATKRLCMFTRPNGSFEVCIIEKKFGVSITNRIYTREKKLHSLIYKDRKFWCINNEGPRGKVIRPLTIGGMHMFWNNWGYTTLNDLYKTLIYDIFHKKFGFIGFLYENDDLHYFPFTVVLQKKLFGYKDVMRYRYKSPYPTALLASKNLKSYGVQDKVKVWNETLKVLIKPDHLTQELLNHHLFMDTCKMAATLNRKVNCTWGLKRLTQEHDKWSKEITQIILETEPLTELRIRNVYVEFEKFSGFKLLRTNKDLMYEGLTQQHCVGTYISRVDSGSTGIYHVGGGTLQLSYETNNFSRDARVGGRDGQRVRRGSKRLVMNQFRTLRNDPLPKDVHDRVLEKVIEFNEMLDLLELKGDEKSDKFLNDLDFHPPKKAGEDVQTVGVLGVEAFDVEF